MAMTINTNVQSLNAQRNLSMSTESLSRSLERLSSGLRITRAGGALAGDAPAIEFLNSGKVTPTTLPFSEAVRVGNTLYLSGQIGIKPGTLELAPGGIEGEARQTLENIRITLETHGYSLRDVVKCTVMLADIAEWAVFNDAYRGFFSPPYPARSALGANGLVDLTGIVTGGVLAVWSAGRE